MFGPTQALRSHIGPTTRLGRFSANYLATGAVRDKKQLKVFWNTVVQTSTDRELVFNKLPFTATSFQLCLDAVITDPELEILGFNGCEIDDSKAMDIAQKLKNSSVRVLLLRDNEINDHGAAVLAENLASKLHKMNLLGNPISERVKDLIEFHHGCDIKT